MMRETFTLWDSSLMRSSVFYRDHQPPHFHAVYGDYQVTADIDSGAFAQEAALQANITLGVKNGTKNSGSRICSQLRNSPSFC
jgi:hypothetical protein